jgi:uroporphyrinogen-III synthase
MDTWTVINTRPKAELKREAADELSRALRLRGAAVCEIPLQRLVATEALADVPSALSGLKPGDWVVFTSAQGVRFVRESCAAAVDSFPAGVLCAAVGRKTAGEFERWSGRVDCIAPASHSASLAAELIARIRKQRQRPRVLLLRGENAGKRLPAQLQAEVGELREIAVYASFPRLLSPEEEAQLYGRDVAERRLFHVFTNSESVRLFSAGLRRQENWQDRSGHLKVAVIGPETAATAVTEGLPLSLRASSADFQILADELAAYCRT